MRPSTLSVYGVDMDISISDQNIAHIRRKLMSGRYSSTNDVLGEALALLDERDRKLESELAEMRESVRRGTEQADAGEVIPADKVFDELRRQDGILSSDR